MGKNYSLIENIISKIIFLGGILYGENYFKEKFSCSSYYFFLSRAGDRFGLRFKVPSSHVEHNYVSSSFSPSYQPFSLPKILCADKIRIQHEPKGEKSDNCLIVNSDTVSVVV